jgi:hypothetical protein
MQRRFNLTSEISRSDASCSLNVSVKRTRPYKDGSRLVTITITQRDEVECACIRALLKKLLKLDKLLVLSSECQGNCEDVLFYYI